MANTHSFSCGMKLEKISFRAPFPISSAGREWRCQGSRSTPKNGALDTPTHSDALLRLDSRQRRHTQDDKPDKPYGARFTTLAQANSTSLRAHAEQVWP